MANIKNFSEAANILQDVDISDIFKSLAMGIAEAQAKLDDNSINQLTPVSYTHLDVYKRQRPTLGQHQR